MATKRSLDKEFESAANGHKKCNKTAQELIQIDHTSHADYAYHQQMLRNASLDGGDTDIKFVVDNQEISAHRPVIDILKDKRQLVRNAIERDRQMARKDNAEEATVFQMSGTTVEAFRKLLIYIYSGTVECDLMVGIDLGTTANKLKFHPLVASLAQHLNVHKNLCLSAQTVDDLYQIAKSAGNKDLLKTCAKFMDENPYDVSGGALKRDVQTSDPNKVLIYLLDKNRFNNYIHFLLPETTEICFTVDVSSDRTNWTVVLKNNEIWSKFWNWVYFEERRIRYIRFVLTDTTADRPFDIRKIKDEHIRVKRANVDLEFDKHTKYLIPKHDIIKFPIRDTKYVFDHKNNTYTYCTSVAANRDKEKHYYYHNIGDGHFLEFFLSQTCLIDSFQLRLWDIDKRTYDFQVEVKNEEEEEYTVVKDNTSPIFKHKSSWVTVHVRPRRAIRWVKITGLRGPTNDREFAIIDFECPVVQKSKH